MNWFICLFVICFLLCSGWASPQATLTKTGGQWELQPHAMQRVCIHKLNLFSMWFSIKWKTFKMDAYKDRMLIPLLSYQIFSFLISYLLFSLIVGEVKIRLMVQVEHRPIFFINIRVNDDVTSINASIAKILGLKVGDFYVTVANRTMKDGVPIREYNIKDNDVVCVNIRLVGGMKKKVDVKKKTMESGVPRTDVGTDNERKESSDDGSDGIDIPSLFAPKSRADKGGTDEEEEEKEEKSSESDAEPSSGDLADQIALLVLLVRQQNEKVNSLDEKLKEYEKERERRDRKEVKRGDLHSPFKVSKNNSNSGVNNNNNNNSSNSSYKTNTTNTTNSSSAPRNKQYKAVSLKNIEPYDGKGSFSEWFKLFNVKIKAGNLHDNVKLLTLMDYLSPSINIWLAELDDETLETYDKLVEVLNEEFGKQEKTTTKQLLKLLNMKQVVGEAVAAYAARVASAEKDCQSQVKGETLVDVFLDGLEEGLQKEVRNEVKRGENNIDVVLSIAKEKELNLIKTNEAINRHATNTPSSLLTNSTNNIAKSPLCLFCNANAPPSGKMFCKTCFSNAKGTKTGNSNNNNNTSNINNNSSNNNSTINNNKNNSTKVSNNTGVVDKICSKCNVEKAFPGKGWCTKCYNSSKTNNSNVSNNNNNNNNNTNNNNNNVSANSTNPPDFSVNKVRYLKTDDNSTNPLYWTNDKLYNNRLCYYCAKEMTGHHTKCQDKYPYYQSAEVRALLNKGIVVPVRGARPTGPPMSP
jgi:hypothetical protein